MSLSSVRVIRRVTGWGWPHFPLEARPNLVRSLRLCVDGAERRLAVSLVPALLPNDTLTHQQTQMAGDPFPGFFLFGYLTSPAGHIDGISADSQWRLHQLLHPDIVKLTFWSGTEGTLLWIRTHTPLPPIL